MRKILKFSDTQVNYRGDNVTIAFLENENGEQELFGKHYKSSGLCWNYADEVRDVLTLEKWKEKCTREALLFLGVK